MDKAEARSILAKERAKFATRSYDELVALIKYTEFENVAGESGANYQIEINVFRDSKPDGDLRIMASIDDGGWRACFPLTDSLIMKPDGALL